MRTENTTTNKTSEFYVNGTLAGASNPVYSTKSVSRSDIVRNSKDSKGFLPPSEYLAVINNLSGPFGVNTNTSYGYTLMRKGNQATELYSRGPGLPGGDAGLRSRAEVGALLKLKDQDVNLGLMFAERKRTADLFAATISTVARAYSAVKKGDLIGASKILGISEVPRRTPRNVAGKWLALQYGWKPLLSDVHGACEVLSGKEATAGYRVTVRKRVKREWEDEYFLDTGPSFCPFIQERRLHTSYHVSLTYEPSGFEAAAFSELGLTNPGLLAWELIPFSFIVDWALPVGDWLSALDAANGYTFLGGSITERRFVIARYRGASQHSGRNVSQLTAGVDFLKRVKRDIYPYSPIPTLPRAKNPWSYTHAANAAAILAQVVLGAKAPSYAK